jgi:hypothetical protein
LSNSIPRRIKALPIPWRWRSGLTEIGPRPNQSSAAPPIVTGENAACPTIFPFSSATRDKIKSPERRKPSMIDASDPLLNSIGSNAATVK